MEEIREENYNAEEIGEDELDNVTGGSEILSSGDMVFRRKSGTTPTSESAVASGAQKNKKAKTLFGVRRAKSTDRGLGDSTVYRI